MIARTTFASFEIAPRVVLTRALLTGFVLALALTTLRFGTYPIATADLLTFLIRGGDGIAHTLVVEHRLPRLMTALGVGVAFGLAGALFQTMLRNPLASPDWIGFTPGASFGALLAIYATGGNVIPGAVLGTLATAAVVLALAMDQGLNVRKLIVIGIGANLSIAAAADLLLAQVDLMTAADMTKWLVGSLNGRDWADVAVIWVGLAALLPGILAVGFPLKGLMLSDDVARGQGIAVSAMRLLTAGLGVVLVALGVAVAGPLPFVAFLAGPIAKGLEGGTRPALYSAAMVGALVVLAADYVARLVPLVLLPAGVFTALIGAPCLLVLLVIAARRGQI